MSFLQGALLVVGAAVGVMTGGLGLLAAGVLLVGAASQFGIIGGSVGKFMKSGWGAGLMAAVTLGSAAYAAYGSSALGAGETAANASAAGANTTTGAAGAALDSTSTAAPDAAAVATENSFVQATGTADGVSSIAGDGSLAQSATGTVGQAAVNQAPVESGGLGASSAQASQEATASDAAAVNPGQASGMTASGAQSTNNAAMAGSKTIAGADGAPDITGTPSEVNAAVNPTGGGAMDALDQQGAPGAAPGAGGGMLKTAGDIAKTPGALQGIGSLLGGIGQGISQKQATEDAIMAQQWGNLQWQNPAQISQLEHAAAAPVTVPQGYLQRAQAVRNMMGSNVGPQPTSAGTPATAPPVPSAMAAPAPRPPGG